MLILTDRPAEIAPLAAALSAWGHCDIVNLVDWEKAPVAPRRLIIIDVDMSARRAVEILRRAIAHHRSGAEPCLSLLRDHSVRATLQANAIGVIHVLAADAPLSVVLQSAAQLMQWTQLEAPGASPTQVQAHFIAATAALADMLDAAAAGRILPRSAIDSSVDTVNQAAESADLESWLTVVWNHDDLTYQHCLLVAGLAAAFAHRLQFSAEDRRRVTCAAVLHDIGKARIPREILTKEGELDTLEMAAMRRHPALGAAMLREQGGFGTDIIAVARSHHEYLDGSGYPDGLKGGEISDLVRMITICDIYAALIERRSYKPAMAPQAAYDILLGMNGKLDADLLRAFKSILPAEAA